MGSPPWVTNLMRNMEISMNMGGRQILQCHTLFRRPFPSFDAVSRSNFVLLLSTCTLSSSSSHFYIALPISEPSDCTFFRNGGTDNLVLLLDYVRTTPKPRLGDAEDSDRLGKKRLRTPVCGFCDFQPTNHRGPDKEPEDGPFGRFSRTSSLRNGGVNTGLSVRKFRVRITSI